MSKWIRQRRLPEMLPKATKKVLTGKTIRTVEKIHIPEPRRLSGEDSAIDVRFRMKQNERYMSAKDESIMNWTEQPYDRWYRDIEKQEHS